MKVNFAYNKEKDAWCILNKGKSSNNSSKPTKQYEQLVGKYGESPTVEDAAVFASRFVVENKIDVLKRSEEFSKDWESISIEFQRRAEDIFGVTLPNDIIAYLTINARCPYNINGNYFFVSLQLSQTRRIVMHELWHFYTWYGVGIEQEEKLGKQRYNDLKEALTVLINVECKDLLPDGIVDAGYPQHREIRTKILEYWAKDRNIKRLWNYLLE